MSVIQSGNTVVVDIEPDNPETLLMSRNRERLADISHADHSDGGAARPELRRDPFDAGRRLLRERSGPDRRILSTGFHPAIPLHLRYPCDRHVMPGGAGRP